MRKIFLSLLFLPTILFAQIPQTQPVIYTSTGTISIGSGVVANSKSLLDLTSTTKGFLAPRMTTTQRDAISSPATGLQIYNTTTGAINYYNGSSWVATGTGSGTVTSVGQSFTGGLISVGGTPVTTSGTLALTVAGTSGGIPYFSSGSTWASSGALSQYGIVIGGGAGAAPTTPTGLTYSSSTLYSPLIDVGTSSSAAGVVYFRNATNAFSQGIRGSVAPANIIYNLPSTEPTAGQVLSSTAPSAGVATLSWATAGGGITVGTTTISSGTTGSIGMNIGGTYTESISYRAQQATPFSTAFGFESHSSGSFSGIKNTSIGYQAGKGITTGTDNTCIGYTSGTGITTGQYNTVIGSNSASPSTTSSNTWIGYNAGVGATVSNVVAIGAGSGSYAGTQSVFIGNNTGTNASGADYAVVIGNSSNTGYGTRGNIVIGYGLPTGNITASHQGVLGTNDANGYVDNWYFNGVTAASPYSVVLNASGGSGTNIAGASFTSAAGKSTGNAIAPDLKYQTSVAGASGTTAQTLGDRYSIVGKYTTLTESSATSFVRVNVPTSTVSGGVIVYTVEANDGTDFQALTGTLPYSIVNKAGTSTIVLGTDTQASSTSTGTLTGTITAVDATSGNVDFKMNAVSSLTQTVLRINCQVIKNFGTGSISAQ